MTGFLATLGIVVVGTLVGLIIAHFSSHTTPPEKSDEVEALKHRLDKIEKEVQAVRETYVEKV